MNNMYLSLILGGLTLVFATGAYLLSAWSPLGWSLLWPALSCLIVCSAYALNYPQIFHKQTDGRLKCTPLTILVLPFLCGIWLLWYLLLWIREEECCHLIANNIYIGRKPRKDEVPREVSLIVDLTAEFAATPSIKTGRTYLTYPLLDGSIPPNMEIKYVIKRILEEPGVVLIHCANGHGRACLLMSLILLYQKRVNTPLAALQYIQKIRSLAKLHPNQLAFVERFIRENPQL